MANENTELDEAKKRLKKFLKNRQKKTSDQDEPDDLVSGVLDEVGLARTKKIDEDEDEK